MSTQIKTNLDLSQNQILNAVEHILTSAPSSPKEGQRYYNSTDKKVYVYNGTAWKTGTEDVEASISSLQETVNGISIPAYTVVKQETAESGYASTYYLTKDGTQIGTKINIPKDMVVQSGEVKTVTTANSPVTGYAVGDKYIDLVLANATNSHIYILVSDLVDTYTAGNGITITGKSIAVDTSVVATQTDVAAKTSKQTFQNTALTPSGGVATWTVTHTLGTKDVITALYEVSTGSRVIADVTISSTTQIVVKINASSAIAANTYKIVVIGV